MKRISPEKTHKVLNSISFHKVVSTALLFSMVSCSALQLDRRSLFGEDDVEEPKKTKAEVQTSVPKAQYDQLVKKYEALLEKTREGKTSANLKQAVAESPFGGKDPADLVSELSQVKPKGELVETVDVFGKNGLVNNTAPKANTTAVMPSVEPTGNDIESQIAQLRKAQTLISQNRLDQALTLLKELEQSPVKQVRVRSKYYLGELLFVQGEYDLAMQIFEEIIQKDAFSGVVINALGRLIVCSEKLKLQKKKEKYYSILHDFFES